MKKRDDELKRKIIEAIRKELERRKMSQTEFGNLCGISRNHTNNILNMTESVSINKILTMTDALGLDVDVKIIRRRT